jgi:vacuolar protein sorting-associated protein 45
MLARRVSEVVTSEKDLFNFGRGDGVPLLLIVDRREDPVTPLLTQWTYQAMVHELIGIDKNTVNLSSAPGIHADLKCVVTMRWQSIMHSLPMPAALAPLTSRLVAYERREVVLAPTLDSFFRDNQFSSFGELGSAVQRIVDAFSEERKAHESIKSIGTPLCPAVSW